MKGRSGSSAAQRESRPLSLALQGSSMPLHYLHTALFLLFVTFWIMATEIVVSRKGSIPRRD